MTSLAYGRVEDGGIRCPFHGWLYDINGRCLEQPAEPEPFADRVLHLSYPCEELGGLIFAYMRVMYLLALEDIKKGKDPKHVIRDPAMNEIIYIRGDGEDEAERA